jgi:hypothetical protein
METFARRAMSNAREKTEEGTRRCTWGALDPVLWTEIGSDEGQTCLSLPWAACSHPRTEHQITSRRRSHLLSRGGTPESRSRDRRLAARVLSPPRDPLGLQPSADLACPPEPGQAGWPRPGRGWRPRSLRARAGVVASRAGHPTQTGRMRAGPLLDDSVLGCPASLSPACAPSSSPRA